MNREEILKESIKCVTRDRNATHGEPEDNFRAIADLQNAYLKAVQRHRYFKGEANVAPDISLTSVDVAVLNILQKVARIVTTPECPDHWIDIAGYAACGGGIGEPLKKEAQ